MTSAEHADSHRLNPNYEIFLICICENLRNPRAIDSILPLCEDDSPLISAHAGVRGGELPGIAAGRLQVLEPVRAGWLAARGGRGGDSQVNRHGMGGLAEEDLTGRIAPAGDRGGLGLHARAGWEQHIRNEELGLTAV